VAGGAGLDLLRDGGAVCLAVQSGERKEDDLFEVAECCHVEN
jgi:hypothetical protein